MLHLCAFTEARTGYMKFVLGRVTKREKRDSLECTASLIFSPLMLCHLCWLNKCFANCHILSLRSLSVCVCGSLQRIRDDSAIKMAVSYHQDLVMRNLGTPIISQFSDHGRK